MSARYLLAISERSAPLAALLANARFEWVERCVQVWLPLDDHCLGIVQTFACRREIAEAIESVDGCTVSDVQVGVDS